MVLGLPAPSAQSKKITYSRHAGDVPANGLLSGVVLNQVMVFYVLVLLSVLGLAWARLPVLLLLLSHCPLGLPRGLWGQIGLR